MKNQRLAALFFLVCVIAFFTWEKISLQIQASNMTRSKHAAVKSAPIVPILAVPTPAVVVTTDSRQRLPEGGTPLATLVPKDRVTLAQSKAPSNSLEPLNYMKPAVADPSCPLPVLHPSKFQGLMGWGVRKQFPPCVPAGQSRFANMTLKDHRPTVTVTLPSCVGVTKVYAFGEMKDEVFQRLSSTLDAETRQNELKERFANVESFAAMIEGFGSEFVLPTGSPYAVAECNGFKQLLISAPPAAAPPAATSRPPGSLKNVLHIMIDSTSIYALRRGAKRIVEWMERIHAAPDGSSFVFPMKHYHAVSCCSPGNQIPMYSGNMNGEGDFFVQSEPLQSSRDWLWNIAKKQGFRTFWSLDNCPDKSARDYHAFPSVDSRVVAPICLAGVLLSHREATCLGGMSVDEQVLSGLESFWGQHAAVPKFAAVQFITPHEDTEKLLIELDIVLAAYFERLERSGSLNDTGIVFWSDHGINFGKYASTHDGEIEKMFPFANVILPRWFAKDLQANLRDAADKLTTPYDMYEVARSMLYYPSVPPPFKIDPANPPLPRPEDSHIMASFPKQVKPTDLTRHELEQARNCWDANIPMEFCTCIAWKKSDDPKYAPFYDRALEAHVSLLANFTRLCHEARLGKRLGVEVQQWPEEYKPKGKDTAKKIWMKPNRDMVKVHYETSGLEGKGVYFATFSIDKRSGKYDLAQIDRLDAMTKKCGITDKVPEQLCICR